MTDNDMFKGGGTSIQSLNNTMDPRGDPPRGNFIDPRGDPRGDPRSDFSGENDPRSPRSPFRGGEEYEEETDEYEEEYIPRKPKKMKKKEYIVGLGIGDKWQSAVVVSVLFVLLNNQFIYGLQNKLIPEMLQFGSPSIINIVLSSILAGLLFLLFSLKRT
jgi:hypothetical protein